MPSRIRGLHSRAFLIGVALLVPAIPAVAQESTAPPAEVPIRRPILASVGLGTAGLLVGGIVGALPISDCSGDQCEIERAVVWGMVGITAGSALGAHLGNKRKGSFPLDVLASGAAMAGGLLLTNLVSEDNGSPILLMVPIAQVVAAVTTERNTGRKRSRGVEVAVGPVGRDIGLIVRVAS